jgi:hypothetical protein
MASKVGIAIACVLAVPLLLAAGLVGIVSALTGSGNGAISCTPGGAATGSVAGYGADQLANAATITTVGKQLQIPEQGWVVAIAVAIQESTLRNLDHGDRDSLGLFQQRPSQGWGTPAQILDPTYAATQFYQHLQAVPGWQQMSLNNAAQTVQRSGTPNAYGQHEKTAQAIVAAVSGVSCATGQLRTDWPPEHATMPDPTSGGRITSRTFALVQALRTNGMTGTGLGCYAHRPANPTSDHPQGRACDIMVNPHSQTSVTDGGRVANWLIAHQPDLGVRYLIWQGQYWSADKPTWVTYQSSAYGCPNPNNLTGCHYDHIHVSMY